MNTSSNISIIIGLIMLTLTLVNAITLNELSPAIERSEVLSALTSISILFIGFLQQRPINKENTKLKDIDGEDQDQKIGRYSELFVSSLPYRDQLSKSALYINRVHIEMFFLMRFIIFQKKITKLFF